MTIIVRLSVVGRTSLAGGLDHVKLESVGVWRRLCDRESLALEPFCDPCDGRTVARNRVMEQNSVGRGHDVKNTCDGIEVGDGLTHGGSFARWVEKFFPRACGGLEPL